MLESKICPTIVSFCSQGAYSWLFIWLSTQAGDMTFINSSYRSIDRFDVKMAITFSHAEGIFRNDSDHKGIPLTQSGYPSQITYPILNSGLVID